MGHSLLVLGFVLHPPHLDFSKSAADCSEISKAEMKFQVLVIEYISAASQTLKNVHKASKCFANTMCVASN